MYDEKLTPEQKIRYQSLLVALNALDSAGENIEIGACEHGHYKIYGESGVVQFDPSLKDGFGAWVFDGVDGSEMYV